MAFPGLAPYGSPRRRFWCAPRVFPSIAQVRLRGMGNFSDACSLAVGRWQASWSSPLHMCHIDPASLKWTFAGVVQRTGSFPDPRKWCEKDICAYTKVVLSVCRLPDVGRLQCMANKPPSSTTNNFGLPCGPDFSQTYGTMVCGPLGRHDACEAFCVKTRRKPGEDHEGKT